MTNGNQMPGMATNDMDISKKALWTGRIMMFLTVAFLIFDATIHILKPQFVIDSFIQLGYNPNVSLGIGLTMLVSLILYCIPRTSILGAILITGYLGGAVATNVRVEAPLFSNILFPVYVGIWVWGALWFRDRKIRALIPFKK